MSMQGSPLSASMKRMAALRVENACFPWRVMTVYMAASELSVDRVDELAPEGSAG